MTKSEYAKLLLTVEWDTVRRAVLKRDKYCCKRCGASNQRLSVHHRIYLENKMPWEVPMKYLESLCDRCHEVAHEGRLISSFVKKSVSSTEQKKKKRKEKFRTLTQEDKTFIAKLHVLQTLFSSSKIWKTYKERISKYRSLTFAEKETTNKSFDKVVKDIK